MEQVARTFSPPTPQHLHIIRALERGGFGGGALAQAALHHVDGVVLARLHPRADPLDQFGDLAGAFC